MYLLKNTLASNIAEYAAKKIVLWNFYPTLKFLLLKAGLHYGDYRSKLAHFEVQKNIFYVKKALA